MDFLEQMETRYHTVQYSCASFPLIQMDVLPPQSSNTMPIEQSQYHTSNTQPNLI